MDRITPADIASRLSAVEQQRRRDRREEWMLQRDQERALAWSSDWGDR